MHGSTISLNEGMYLVLWMAGFFERWPKSLHFAVLFGVVDMRVQGCDVLHSEYTCKFPFEFGAIVCEKASDGAIYFSCVSKSYSCLVYVLCVK